MAVTGAIIATAATVATTGYQATASHDAKVEARHDQAKAQSELQADAAAKDKASLDAQGMVAARQRQRALASSMGPGSGVTQNSLGGMGKAGQNLLGY